MSASLEIFPEEMLLDRLVANAQAGRSVTFLVGSPLTSPVGPHHLGVPQVSGMIELVCDTLGSPTNPSLSGDADAYQEAFRQLLASRGPEAVSKVVRQAVLKATLDASLDLHQQALNGDAVSRRRACAALEGTVSGWSLSPGVEYLGKIAASFPTCFGQTILTSNFDPLIEISIRRAGGACWRTAPHVDGNLHHSRGHGCHVVHVHGYWYDVDTLHIPTQLQAERPQLRASLRRLFEDTTLVVVAYGGWDDVFSKALIDVIGDGGAFPEVIWTFRERRVETVLEDSVRLLDRLRPGLERAGRVTLYGGIDCHTFFPQLWQRLPAAIELGGWELFKSEGQGLSRELDTLADDLARLSGQQLVAQAIQRLEEFGDQFVRPQCRAALVVRATPTEFLLRGISSQLRDDLLDRLSVLSIAWGNEVRPWSAQEPLGDIPQPLGLAGVAIPFHLPGQQFSGHLFFLHAFPFSPAEVRVLIEAARTLASIISAEQDRRLVKAALNRFRHGIIGPIQGLLSVSQVLGRLASTPDRNPDQIQRTLDKLQVEAESLRLTIRSQKFATFENIALRPRRSSLRRLLAECVKRYTRLAAEHEIAIEIVWPRPNDILLYFDSEALDVVIANLLDNAVKYSFFRRRIRLGANLEPKRVCIWVENTGHAIPDEVRTAIFERGVRVLGGDSLRSIAGAGMGLALAVAIVRAHGGDISFSSKPTGGGKGASSHVQPHMVRFMVCLPSEAEEG